MRIRKTGQWVVTTNKSQNRTQTEDGFFCLISDSGMVLITIKRLFSYSGNEHKTQESCDWPVPCLEIIIKITYNLYYNYYF